MRLAEILPFDLKSLSPEHDERTLTEVLEVFGDPMFEHLDVIAQDVKELATAYPAAAQAIVHLYAAFRAVRESAHDLAETLTQDTGREHSSRFPKEEVADLIQARMNYFPDLELGAEALWRDAVLVFGSSVESQATLTVRSNVHRPDY